MYLQRMITRFISGIGALNCEKESNIEPKFRPTVYKLLHFRYFEFHMISVYSNPDLLLYEDMNNEYCPWFLRMLNSVKFVVR